MKKLFTIAIAATFIASIIIIWVFGAVTSGKDLKIQKRIEKISINSSQIIKLDFPATDIEVYGWNKDNVEVQINNLVYGNNKTVIKVENNSILLDRNAKVDKRGLIVHTVWPWLPLLHFEKYRTLMNHNVDYLINTDFIIYLPKDAVVDIKAGELTIANCKLSSLSANMATVNKCTILKSFNGITRTITVRNSIISKDSNFNSKINNFENNTYINDK